MCVCVCNIATLNAMSAIEQMSAAMSRHPLFQGPHPAFQLNPQSPIPNPRLPTWMATVFPGGAPKKTSYERAKEII